MINVIIAKLANEKDLASKTLPIFINFTDAVSYVYQTVIFDLTL